MRLVLKTSSSCCWMDERLFGTIAISRAAACQSRRQPIDTYILLFKVLIRIQFPPTYRSEIPQGKFCELRWLFAGKVYYVRVAASAMTRMDLAACQRGLELGACVVGDTRRYVRMQI